ncbi:MAG TPA: hypothetical protein VLM11_13635 [Streptosporangiaceae bacterium]|nr:hypothetical protein [Streptosporangiaceae bacterium]
MAAAPDPVEIISAGSAILEHVLSPAGFTFQLTGQGHGSGGAFAASRFTKGTQYLEFHFRLTAGATPPSPMPTICAAQA